MIADNLFKNDLATYTTTKTSSILSPPFDNLQLINRRNVDV